MTAASTPNLTPNQFAEHFRRMLFGLVRGRALLVKMQERGQGTFTGARTTAEAIAMIDRAEKVVEEDLEPDWRARVAANDYRKFAIDFRGLANRPDGLGGGIIKNVYGYVENALGFAQDLIRADVDFRLAVANARMEFWRRLKELGELPGDVLAAIARGVARAAVDVAKPLLGGLLEALKQLLPYAAAAFGGYLLLQGGGRGRT